MQNPFVHPKNIIKNVDNDNNKGVVNLIWIGRLSEPKQPLVALDAFARAVSKYPKLTLTMIGGENVGIANLKMKSKKLDIESQVVFVPEQPDINEYWAKADIHLLTSICESFCLVWAEAKAAGIPTVMFELPYLELAQDSRGYVSVEQKNVDALADAIVDLARNNKKRIAMGREASESLAPFNDDAVWDSWMRLYEGLDNDEAGTYVDPNLKTIVSQIYFAVNHDKVNHRWPERMENDFRRLTKCSMKSFAKLLHGFVECVAKFKRKLH